MLAFVLPEDVLFLLPVVALLLPVVVPAFVVLPVLLLFPALAVVLLEEALFVFPLFPALAEVPALAEALLPTDADAPVPALLLEEALLDAMASLTEAVLPASTEISAETVCPLHMPYRQLLSRLVYLPPLCNALYPVRCSTLQRVQ